MTEQERQAALLDAVVTMEASVIEAHAKFAKIAIELGEPEMATCSMANAIMLIEYMDEQGRCAEAIPAIMQILPKLTADGGRHQGRCVCTHQAHSRRAQLMVAPLAVAAIGAGASLFSSITGGKGAKKAANIAAQSAAQDRALAQGIYNQNVGLAQPIVDRGNAAGAQINALLGLGGNAGAAQDALAAWRGSTGYQTGLQTGLDAVNTGYAARGALESGAAQKALMRLGTDYSNQNFGQYVGMLQGQQGAGLNALGAVTGAGSSYVQNVTNANQGAASAQANAALYGAQSQQNALAGVANLAGNFLSGSSYNQRYDNALGNTIRNQANGALDALSLSYFNKNPWS